MTEMNVLQSGESPQQTCVKAASNRMASHWQSTTQERIQAPDKTEDTEHPSQSYQAQELSRSNPLSPNNDMVTTDGWQTARHVLDSPSSSLARTSIAPCRPSNAQAILNETDIKLHMNTFPCPYASEDDRAFYTASLHPPINSDTLRILDLHNLATNTSLLHDLHFDRELHMRPNNDSSKSIRNIKAARTYWLAIRRELEIYDHLLAPDTPFAHKRWTQRWTDVFKSHSERIPRLFTAMKTILYGITPEIDHDTINEVIDEELIMQQIAHGTFDLVAFVQWLTAFLRQSCPPLRDAWLKRLSRYFSEVVMSQCDVDVDGVVSGVEELFYVFEAIKLDMANHYIRTNRSELLKNAFAAEQEYARNRVDRGRVNPRECRAWLADAAATVPIVSVVDDNELPTSRSFCQRSPQPVSRQTTPTSRAPAQLLRLITAIVNHLMPGFKEKQEQRQATTRTIPHSSSSTFDLNLVPDRASLPTQFKHDRRRLLSIAQSIEHQVLVRVSIAELHRNLDSHDIKAPSVVEEATHAFLTKLYAIDDVFETRSSNSNSSSSTTTEEEASSLIALELARVLLPLILKPLSTIPHPHPRQPAYPTNSSPSPHMQPLEYLTTHLHHSLVQSLNPASAVYTSQVNRLAHQLRRRCRELVFQNVSRGAEEMASSFLSWAVVGDESDFRGGPQPHGSENLAAGAQMGLGVGGRGGDEREGINKVLGDDDRIVEEMARKLAHVVCVHWRVWGEVVYLTDRGDDDDDDNDDDDKED